MSESGMVPWEQAGTLDYGRYAEDRAVVKLDKVPVLHLVQNNSPEADAGLAKPGDVVIRLAGRGNPANPNLGARFNGCCVARGTQYVWWGNRDESDGGGPLARCVKGDPIPPGCDAMDVVWPDRGGTPREDGKAGPVADETQTLLVCPLDGEELGPAALLSYSRGSKKVGDGVQMLLNAFRGPQYAAVLEFYSEKLTNADGKPYYVLKAKPSRSLAPDSPLLPKLRQFYEQNQPHLTPKTK